MHVLHIQTFLPAKDSDAEYGIRRCGGAPREPLSMPVSIQWSIDRLIDRSYSRRNHAKPLHISQQRAWNDKAKRTGPSRPHFILHIIRCHSHYMPCSISKALRHFLRQRKTQHRQNLLGSNACTTDSVKTFPPIPTAVDFCCGFALFLRLR